MIMIYGTADIPRRKLSLYRKSYKKTQEVYQTVNRYTQTVLGIFESIPILKYFVRSIGYVLIAPIYYFCINHQNYTFNNQRKMNRLEKVEYLSNKTDLSYAIKYAYFLLDIIFWIYNNMFLKIINLFNFFFFNSISFAKESFWSKENGMYLLYKITLLITSRIFILGLIILVLNSFFLDHIFFNSLITRFFYQYKKKINHSAIAIIIVSLHIFVYSGFLCVFLNLMSLSMFKPITTEPIQDKKNRFFIRDQQDKLREFFRVLQNICIDFLKSPYLVIKECIRETKLFQSWFLKTLYFIYLLIVTMIVFLSYKKFFYDIKNDMGTKEKSFKYYFNMTYREGKLDTMFQKTIDKNYDMKDTIISL